MAGNELAAHPIHLGLGASAEIEPVFSGDMSWYDAYSKRHGADGAEGRLVSLHTFNKSWDVWEMHPHGAEVVICTAGVMTLVQERADESPVAIQLESGQYAINEAGVWHTADIDAGATAIFITSGMGTLHRPRD